MHSVTIACTITILITTYIYIASFKVQLSQQLHCSVSYRWGYLNTPLHVSQCFPSLNFLTFPCSLLSLPLLLSVTLVISLFIHLSLFLSLPFYHPLSIFLFHSLPFSVFLSLRVSLSVYLSLCFFISLALPPSLCLSVFVCR